jgi:hypothetical protein
MVAGTGGSIALMESMTGMFPASPVKVMAARPRATWAIHASFATRRTMT